MKTLIVAYAVIGAFIVAERRLRRGEAARTLQEQPADRGTTRQVGAAFGFALSAGLAAPLLSSIGIGRLPRGLAKAGLCVMPVGLGVRIWAAQTLGRFYTRTLRVADDQPVFKEGPYRWVRHPGYAADLLMWLGFGLASGNALVAGSIVVAMLAAYTRRMAAEEEMLVVHLGTAYREYSRETWRLLPRVY